MLTVVNVAYPYADISEDSVGGAEQVVRAIDSALTRAGHRSIVLASSRSIVDGELLGVDVPPSSVTAALRDRVNAEYRARLAALIASGSIDVLHFHGVDCADYVPEGGPPRIVTLHLASHCYGADLLRRQDLFFTCVSRQQHRALAAVSTEIVIENGVDLVRFHPSPGPRGGYAACLGRICPEKGFDIALCAAHAANVPLKIAGQVFPYAEHERYFAEQIQPLLDASRQFVGPVGGEAKRRFLAEAECLIVPSRAKETSSLVTMEALASGTPVVVSDRGALPTLVEQGVTGFHARTEADFASALENTRLLDRARCRSVAERRFDLRRTTQAYLDLYERVAVRQAWVRAG